jgi:hypothetical protein
MGPSAIRVGAVELIASSYAEQNFLLQMTGQCCVERLKEGFRCGRNVVSRTPFDTHSECAERILIATSTNFVRRSATLPPRPTIQNTLDIQLFFVEFAAQYPAMPSAIADDIA